MLLQDVKALPPTATTGTATTAGSAAMTAAATCIILEVDAGTAVDCRSNNA